MADTEVLLNGFSILGDANTNVSQSGDGILKIHSGDAVFESDDIIVIQATNVSESGEFTYDTIITGIVVYDSALDYFNEVVKYTYEPATGTDGAGIDPGKHGNEGMGDRYLQLDATNLVSSDPAAPTLGDLVMVAGTDLITAVESGSDVNVQTVEDVDYSQNGTIDGENEPGDGQFGTGNSIFSGVVCFAKGTLIETDTGPLPIEILKPGDLVRTLDNDLQPIRWIGSTKVSGMGGNAPIRIEAGTLGNVRDLQVSPNHRMMVTGAKAQLLFGSDQVLVAAKHLLDGQSIRTELCEEIEYFHFLFDQHEIVFAEACPTESLHPGKESLKVVGNRARSEILGLFPALMRTERELARPTLTGREAQMLFTPDYPIGPGLRSSLSNTFASTSPAPGSVMMRRRNTRSKSERSRATTLSR